MKDARPLPKSQGDPENVYTLRKVRQTRSRPRPFRMVKRSPSSSPIPFPVSTKLPETPTTSVASDAPRVTRSISSSDKPGMTGRQQELLATLKAVASGSAAPRKRSASATSNHSAVTRPVTITKPASATTSAGSCDVRKSSSSSAMLHETNVDDLRPTVQDTHANSKSPVSTVANQPSVRITENQQADPATPDVQDQRESTATWLQADPQIAPKPASEDQTQEKNDTNAAAGNDNEAVSRASSLSLPDLHALLASTQTGRKPRSPSPTIDGEPARGKKRRLSTTGSAAVPPPAKRPAGARRRHHDFWALDGSVVLQLESVMFRLHRSDLVRRSKYFADLLAAGESAEADKVDGCPVYQVPGKAKDFERLWRAVDDAISYVHTPPAFHVLASILQAAITYDFPAFRTWAVKTFEGMWPQDLASLSAARRLHATQSILLARACDVPTVLRHAFYELSRHPSFGIEEEHDDTSAEDEDEGDEDSPGPDALSRADLTRLIQLRPRLQSAWLDVVQMPPSSCGKNGCATAPTWASSLVADPIFEEGLLCDPLEALQRLLLRADPEGLCKGCVGKAKAGWARTRVKIWQQKLDLWLGLE